MVGVEPEDTTQTKLMGRKSVLLAELWRTPWSFPEEYLSLNHKVGEALIYGYRHVQAFMVAQTVNNLPIPEDPGSIPKWGRYQRRAWQSTPVFLPGESHGQRRLIVQGVAKSQTRVSG